MVASRWLGGGKAKAQRRGMGWGAIDCHLRHVLFRNCLCISAFCLDEKGCWRTSIVCTHVHEYLYISHLVILLSYLIFDFVCLTLSLADTHEIAKYARTYTQRYTHTRTHKNKKHKKKGGKKRWCNNNPQTTVTHFSENKRLHLESSNQNYYIISLWVIIKAIFTSLLKTDSGYFKYKGGTLLLLSVCLFFSWGHPPSHHEKQFLFTLWSF